jgi:hypothetical protein
LQEEHCSSQLGSTCSGIRNVDGGKDSTKPSSNYGQQSWTLYPKNMIDKEGESFLVASCTVTQSTRGGKGSRIWKTCL